jgi:hypothetical protein
MEDDVHPGNGPAAHVELAKIATQKVDLPIQPGEIGFIPRAEIVDDPNVVSESNQPSGEMRTDEPGTPRH